MSTIGIVVPPLTGHINPLVPVAETLRKRGHRVVWLLHRRRVGHLIPPDHEQYGLNESFPDEQEETLKKEADGTRGLEAFQFLWERFLIPLGRDMAGQVEEGIEKLRPDLLIVDQQALGGAVAARRKGISWMTSSTTSAALIDPFAMVPKVQEWMLDAFRQFQLEMGLEPVKRPDFSPSRLLVFSTAEFMGDTNGVPPQAVFVGPSVVARPQPEAFPMERIARGDAVLVSVGTLNQERSRRFFQVAADALGTLSHPVIAIAPPSLLPTWPSNFIVQARIPQLSILPRCRAVVTHAGHNTVVEALLHGLPLVVAPIRDDQPVIAGQVVSSGAGVRIHFGRVNPERFRAAVETVLKDPGYAAAAQRVGNGFRAAGGSEAAADEVEACLP